MADRAIPPPDADPGFTCDRCNQVKVEDNAHEPGNGLSEAQLRQVRHWYVCEGESVRRIAARSGVRRQRLVALLRASGIGVSPGGTGRARPWTRSPEPAGLRESLAFLYTQQRLSSMQIAELLDMSDRQVRLKLQEFGIRRRTRGRCNREDRHHVDPDLVRELLLEKGLPGTTVSDKTGEPYAAVLRTAHTLGLPVQVSGQPGKGPTHLETLHALYSDDLVRAALRRFHVPRVPAGPALAARFPQPVPLTPELLAALYLECGLSTTHIELLTGHPASTVQRHLKTYQIPLRQAGGRAPIWRRWRNQFS